MGFEHLLGCWLGDHSYCVYPWLRTCLSTNKVSSFCVAKELRKGWTVVWCKNNEKPMNSGNWKAETCHSQRLFTSAESIITSLCVHFFCFVFSRKTRKLISQIMFLELKEMSWAMNQVWILSKQSNLSTLRICGGHIYKIFQLCWSQLWKVWIKRDLGLEILVLLGIHWIRPQNFTLDILHQQLKKKLAHIGPHLHQQ